MTAPPPRRLARLARLLRRLGPARRGSSAVEYAMILPLFLLLTLGAVEVVLIMFEFHRLGEATRRAARVAVIEPPVAELAGMPGTGVTCTGTSTGVTCTTPVRAGGAAVFTRLVAEIQAIAPPGMVARTNVRVRYEDSGITDPAVMAGVITPLVTVELTGVRHRYLLLGGLDNLPLVGGFLGGDTGLDLPPFTTSKTQTSAVW